MKNHVFQPNTANIEATPNALKKPSGSCFLFFYNMHRTILFLVQSVPRNMTEARRLQKLNMIFELYT